MAAGGLVTGAHLASMLALGASGIVVGTRFSIATESVLPQSKKERLIAARSTSRDATVLSPAFDELLGRRHVWPPGTTARGLRMESMLKDEEDGKSIEERRRIFETQNHSGGSHEIIWSGTSVGLIDKIQSAEVSTVRCWTLSHCHFNDDCRKSCMRFTARHFKSWKIYRSLSVQAELGQGAASIVVLSHKFYRVSPLSIWRELDIICVSVSFWIQMLSSSSD